MAFTRRKWRKHYTPRHQIEILLPLFYNDGILIEPEKVDQTVQEIVDEFGGCRITSGEGIPAFNGYWVDEEALYRDAVKSLIVEAPQTDTNFEFLSRLKKILEPRFEQIEIYITVQEIKRIV